MAGEALETFLFTSKSVNEGHPDKLCDQVSSILRLVRPMACLLGPYRPAPQIPPARHAGCRCLMPSWTRAWLRIPPPR